MDNFPFPHLPNYAITNLIILNYACLQIPCAKRERERERESKRPFRFLKLPTTKITLVILVGLVFFFTHTALAQTVDLSLPGGSLRFPENNHETTFAGTYGALYQSTTNFPNLFSTDGALFIISRIPLNRMHDNRDYRIVGAPGVTGGRTFSIRFVGTDYFTEASRGTIIAMVKGTADRAIVSSPIVDEEDVLIVFKRKTNAGPSIDFTVDWYSLADATKHAGTAQENVTFTGMGNYNGSYFGLGVGYNGNLPSSGSKSTARTLGEFPGEIQALGYVGSDIADEDWQAIALGADIITTLGTSTLTYLREFDGTSDTYDPPAGATSDTTSAAVAVDGENLSPGSTLRRQDSANYLTIDYIPAGKVFGLTPASITRSVPFSGTAGGYTGDVEVRLIYADTGVVHKDWTTIGSISSGAWSGTTTVNKSSDGWLIAQARPASNPEVVAEMREPFGVGYKFGVIGQSQAARILENTSRNDQVTTPFKISVSAASQSLFVSKAEKMFRVGPHPGSDGTAYFANQWAEYGDNTPVQIVAIAKSGQSALNLIDDLIPDWNWSDVQTVVDYVDNVFTGLLWQWGTSDNLGGGYGTSIFDAVVKGVGDNAADHYLEDGLTFEPGFDLGLNQLSRHATGSTGPFDTDQSTLFGSTRDTQISWIESNGYKVGPSASDLELDDTVHQSPTALRGNPLFGTRLAMTAARIVGLDTATDPAVATTTFANSNLDSIIVTFNLPNAGSLQTNGQDADVRGFEVSDDSGSTWSRSGFTASTSANTVVLTKSSGAWTGGGATRVRYLFGGPVSYGTSVSQTELLDGLLYESYTPDVLSLGLPVMGSNTALTVVADETAPTVSLSAPVEGVTVSGDSVTISATASDDIGVSGVEFKLNTNTLLSDDTSSPYSIAWDSTTVSNGAHTIIAVARDASGNYATSTAINITVDNAGPARSSASPSGSQSAGTTGVTLAVTTDESSTCKYSTTADTAYASMTNTFSTTGGTSHSTTVSGLANGQSYNYYVRCSDGIGNINTSDFAVSFSVATPASTVNTTSGGSGYDLAFIASHQLTQPQPTTVEGIRALIAQLTQQLNLLMQSGGISGPAFTQPLRFGQTHPQIKVLQQLLNQNPITQVATQGPGSPNKENTYFGPATLRAIKKFQLHYQIVTSPSDPGYGFVGPKTRGKLNELLKAGN